VVDRSLQRQHSVVAWLAIAALAAQNMRPSLFRFVIISFAFMETKQEFWHMRKQGKGVK